MMVKVWSRAVEQNDRIFVPAAPEKNCVALVSEDARSRQFGRLGRDGIVVEETCSARADSNCECTSALPDPSIRRPALECHGRLEHECTHIKADRSWGGQVCREDI